MLTSAGAFTTQISFPLSISDTLVTSAASTPTKRDMRVGRAWRADDVTRRRFDLGASSALASIVNSFVASLPEAFYEKRNDFIDDRDVQMTSQI